MPRPSAAPPQQATDAVAEHAHHEVELPVTDLPVFPDIPDVPADVPPGGGLPSLDAPDFPELSHPAQAAVDFPLPDGPSANLPDFIFDMD